MARPLVALGNQPDRFQQLQGDAAGLRLAGQPVAGTRGVTQSVLAHRVADQAAFADVLAGLFRLRIVEQTFVELLGGPAHDIEQTGTTLIAGRARRIEVDAGAAGEQLQRLPEADVLELLNKTEHVAVFTTGPAAEILPAGIDGEGGVVVVVEGAESFEGRPGRLQGQVAPDDIDDIVGLFDLLDPVVRQGPPMLQEPASEMMNDER